MIELLYDLLIQLPSSTKDDDEESDDDEEESVTDRIKEQVAKPIEKAQHIAESVGNQIRDKVALFFHDLILTD